MLWTWRVVLDGAWLRVLWLVRAASALVVMCGQGVDLLPCWWNGENSGVRRAVCIVEICAMQVLLEGMERAGLVRKRIGVGPIAGIMRRYHTCKAADTRAFSPGTTTLLPLLA